MTSKHYRAIAIQFNAEMLRAENDPGLGARETREIRVSLTNVAWAIAFGFEQDNPKFDRRRFLEACGL